jgi:uncharacterized membrane protein YtjA (UPF0391 family)
MLHLAITFFVFTLIAALLGFTGIALAIAGLAKICFFIFIILFILTSFTHVNRRGNT